MTLNIVDETSKALGREVPPNQASVLDALVKEDKTWAELHEETRLSVQDLGMALMELAADGIIGAGRRAIEEKKQTVTTAYYWLVTADRGPHDG